MNAAAWLAANGGTATASPSNPANTQQATKPMSASQWLAQNSQPPAPTGTQTQQPTSFASKFFNGAGNAANNFSQGLAQGEIKQASNLGGLVDKGLSTIPGGVGKFFSGGVQQNQRVQTSPALQDTSAAQTAGDITSQVAPYFTGAGEDEAIASEVGKLASRVAANSAIGTVQTGSPKSGAEIGAGGEFVGGLAGKALEGIGATAAKIFIPKSDAEAGMLQSYKASNTLLDRIKSVISGGKVKAPSTAGSTAFEKGLMGTESMIGVQAKRAQNKLWSGLIRPALKSVTNPVDMDKFFSDAEASIIKDNPELGRQKSLLDALQSVKEDYAGVKTQTLEQLQKLKEGWAEFVPEKAYKGQSIAGAYNDVRNTLAGQARTQIYNALGDNVKQAYLDYGNLYGITALGRKSMTGAIKGGTGTTLKNLLERFTVPIGTIGGQTLYKIGQIAEFAGPAGAKTLQDILGSVSASNNQSQPQDQQNNQSPTQGTLQSQVFPTQQQNQ